MTFKKPRKRTKFQPKPESLRNLKSGDVHRILPDGSRHPRLCKCVKRGVQCWQFALRGSDYCRFHGGKRSKSTRLHPIGADEMALKFYGKRLGPKLTAYVEEMLAQPHNEQLRLNEELALMRVCAGDALSLYSAANELPENVKNRNEMIANAATIMQASLEQVVKTCEIAARIDAMAKDKFSVHTLQDVVSQLTKLVHDCFAHDEAALLLFDSRLNAELRLPKTTADGTLLTPDMDVMAMDSTIPREPESETQDEDELSDEEREAYFDEQGEPRPEDG